MSKKLESIGYPRYLDKTNESCIIDKPNYKESEQKLFINKTLHFEHVSKEIWEYKIGGYQVLDKYLKSHKGESIDHEHFQKIIQTLHQSLELESAISAIEIL